MKNLGQRLLKLHIGIQIFLFMVFIYGFIFVFSNTLTFISTGKFDFTMVSMQFFTTKTFLLSLLCLFVPSIIRYYSKKK